MTKPGLVVVGSTFLAITLTVLLLEKNVPEGLSCMSVRSNINNLIEEADLYKGKGITNTKKNVILDKLDSSLVDNKRLACKFNENAILRKFSHFSRD